MMALPYTLLSIGRFARLTGINPVHFQGGHSEVKFPLSHNNCNILWHRYSWQAADALSHHELAGTINKSEGQINRWLGFPVAPTWILNEYAEYPSHYNNEYTAGKAATGLRKRVNTRWGKIVTTGKRYADFVGQAENGVELVISDEDGDGFSETATITLTGITDDIDTRTIKVYYADRDGKREWEIRPVDSIEFSGGTLVIKMKSWFFVDLDLQGAYPETDPIQAINFDDPDIYVDAVDVYAEVVDPVHPSALFVWEPTLCGLCSTGLSSSNYNATIPESNLYSCTKCGAKMQPGVIDIVNKNQGVVAIHPASYNEDTGNWEKANFAISAEPSRVRMWYRAGNESYEYKRGDTNDGLSDYYAQLVMWLSVARVNRPICGCAHVTSKTEPLRIDLATSSGNTTRMTEFSVLSNPFGTRRGEVQVWNELRSTDENILSAAVI